MLHSGDKFNRLTVVSFSHKGGSRNENYYLCRCACGRTKSIRESRVRSGITKSCGCLAKEGVAARNRTHGLSLTGKKQARLHRIWSNMKARCSVKTHQSYKNYGGRGISVCDEWFNDYLSFHLWAVSHGYKDTLTIDRIDNDGNYCPENCRWISKSENSGKTRATKLSATDAQFIRQSSLEIKELARMFNISKTHVSSIRNNHRWTKKAA